MEEDSNCPLCIAVVNEQYRFVREDDLVYAMIPIAPLMEGHVMVLPKRHTKMEDLTSEELESLNNMVADLKDKLKEMYPEKPPIIATLSDTKHAAIPEHFHYHIVPSEGKLRKLISTYHNIAEDQKAEPSELEQMAMRLR